MSFKGKYEANCSSIRTNGVNFVAVRYFMDISYKGTNFSGWQIQPNGVTIQGELEKALMLILKAEIAVAGSGRTDAGVHASQQIAHFDTQAALDTDKLIYKLNSFLSKDISIQGIRAVDEGVTARFSAVARTYYYHLHQAKDPFKQGLSYYFQPDINLEKVQKACRIIHEWQNFECFSRVHTEVNNFNCEIMNVGWTQRGAVHLFEITANRFLRGMVRAIVGTLLDVGLGKTSLSELQEILKSNDRTRAGRAVPAEGLYLQAVTYPSNIYRD